jgi:hypothetical protein
MSQNLEFWKFHSLSGFHQNVMSVNFTFVQISIHSEQKGYMEAKYQVTHIIVVHNFVNTELLLGG